MSDLWKLSVGELASAYRGKRATPADVLASLYMRIDAVDQDINAFTSLDRVRARQAAAGIKLDGALSGVPVAVKEVIAVEAGPHTAQSRTRIGVIASQDATMVRRLRDLGAIIIGTTRTHEMAWGITTFHESLGATRNPWHTGHTPGGSSGGSAAAVATGMAPVALGTDTACSIRLPAAFCGVCGFKPTHGLVSLDGVLPLAPSLDHAGILAREVDDIATVFLG